MKDHLRIYWPFTNWSLSGVCTFALKLIDALPQFNHEIHLIRLGAPELPLPGEVRFKTFESCSHYEEFLRYAKPGVIASAYSWRVSYIERLAKHRYVQIIQSDDPYYYIPLYLSKNRWDAVVSVSSVIAKRCSLIGISTTMIPNGVFMPAPYPRKRDKSKLRILYTGRLDQNQKNVLALISFFEELRRASIPYEVRIAGEGNMKEALSEHFSNEELIGYVPSTEIGKHYRWADFFILPSHFEGESLSLMEALAHGCIPLLGEFQSDISELVRQEGLGYVGPTSGMPAYVSQFAEQRKRLGEQSSKVIESFQRSGYHIQEIAVRYSQLFDRQMTEIRQPQLPNPFIFLSLSLFNSLLYAKFCQKFIINSLRATFTRLEK